MKLTIKILLNTSIPFGLLMGLFYSLKYGPLAGMKGGLLAGILFGVLMTLILAPLNFFTKRKNNDFPSDIKKISEVEYSFTLDVNESINKAYEDCIKSASAVKNCNVIKDNCELDKVMANVGSSWKSFGEQITYDINRIGDSLTKISVNSKPRRKKTLVDYGKNRDNIKALYNYFKVKI